MLTKIILLITTIILIIASIAIIRLLAFTRSRKSWVLIILGVLFLLVIQLVDIYVVSFHIQLLLFHKIEVVLKLIASGFITVGIILFGTFLKNNKLSEEQRKESESRFQMLFNLSSDEIFLADFEGNFIEVNQEAIKRLGYSREELMQKNFTDIKTPEFVPLVKKNIEIILKNGKHIYETEHISKDGAIIFLEMNSRVIDYLGEKAILTVARDITERKEMERKISGAIIQTEEKERKRFAVELHDGLAPLLSTIKLYVDLLKKGNFNKLSPEEALNSVDELIEKAIVTTREISNNIMPSILQDFGLPAAIKDFCNYINKTQSVLINLDTSQYKLKGPSIEETVLFQSIKELVHNTLKHSQAKNIDIFLESHENQVNLYYKDDGIGFMVEEKLRQQDGMGLNNIVNKIKTIHGLSLIKSEPGAGMSVLLTLHVKQ